MDGEVLAAKARKNSAITFSRKVWQGIPIRDRRRLFQDYNIHLLAPPKKDDQLSFGDIKDWDSVDGIEQYIGRFDYHQVHSELDSSTQLQTSN